MTCSAPLCHSPYVHSPASFLSSSVWRHVLLFQSCQEMALPPSCPVKTTDLYYVERPRSKPSAVQTALPSELHKGAGPPWVGDSVFQGFKNGQLSPHCTSPDRLTNPVTCIRAELSLTAVRQEGVPLTLSQEAVGLQRVSNGASLAGRVLQQNHL